MEWLAMSSLSSLDTSWGPSQLLLYLPWLCLAQELGGMSPHLEGASALERRRMPTGQWWVEGRTGAGKKNSAAGPGQDILCWGAVLRCALYHPRHSSHHLSILSKMSRNEEVFSYFYLVALWNVLSLLFIKILHFKISRFFNHAIFLSRRP